MRFKSLSFALTVSVPALASTDASWPVMRVTLGFSAFGFSAFTSIFFSGVAGLAGVAWAKDTPAKVRVTRGTKNNLRTFFINSPPFALLDARGLEEIQRQITLRGLS